MAKGVAIVNTQSSFKGTSLDRSSVENWACRGSSPRGSAEACSRSAGDAGVGDNHAPLPSRNGGVDSRRLRSRGTSVYDTSVSEYITYVCLPLLPWISSLASAQCTAANTIASRYGRQAAPEQGRAGSAGRSRTRLGCIAMGTGDDD